ncbi:hypothetical protein D3C75_947760 [compost metagenome]
MEKLKSLFGKVKTTVSKVPTQVTAALLTVVALVVFYFVVVLIVTYPVEFIAWIIISGCLWLAMFFVYTMYDQIHRMLK